MRKPFEAVNGNADESRKSRTASWAVALGCALATRIVIAGVAGFLVHCDDRLAGSSVITGNPTEIQLGFVGENGPVAFTGRVEIYGATQIPVPGFQPEPLVRFEVDGTQDVSLDAGRFENIPDSLWPAGSVEGDSLARFNLVAIGAGEGAIVRELGFRIDKGRFQLKEGSWKQGEDGSSRVAIGLSASKSYQASLDPATLNRKKHHFLFLYGTGYYAQGDSGTFVFQTLPDGAHHPAFFSIPTEELQISSPQDSVEVYSLNRPLSPEGPNPAIADSVRASIPIPESLK